MVAVLLVLQSDLGKEFEIVVECGRSDRCGSTEKGEQAGRIGLGDRAFAANGNGVLKDSVQAVFWYRKSAEQGNAWGQNSLGAMYENGNGVPKDLVIAYMWKNLAAYQGYETAKRAREALGKIMTSAQIAEAQRLSYEWEPKP